MRLRGTPLPHPIFAAKTARPRTWQRCACKDGFCRKSVFKRQNKHYKRLFCKIVAFVERRKYYADIRKFSLRALPVSQKFSAFRPKEKRQEKISSRYLLTKIGLISRRRTLPRRSYPQTESGARMRLSPSLIATHVEYARISGVPYAVQIRVKPRENVAHERFRVGVVTVSERSHIHGVNQARRRVTLVTPAESGVSLTTGKSGYVVTFDSPPR